MSHRHLYLVSYDIANTKRLYRVHKTIKEYAVGGQNSCYECWMTHAEINTLEQHLRELMDAHEDRIHIFQLDPRMNTELIGRAQPARTDIFMLV